MERAEREMEFYTSVSPPLSPRRRLSVELKPVYSAAVNGLTSNDVEFAPSPSPLPPSMVDTRGHDGLVVRDSFGDDPHQPPAEPHCSMLAITSDRIGATGYFAANDAHIRLAALPVRGPMKQFLQREGSVLMRLRRAPAHPAVALPIGCAGDTELESTQGAVLLLPRFHMDLHTVAVGSGGLPEVQVRSIFGQMLAAVQHCHTHRILLGDVRLSKFAFTGSDQKTVQLVDLTRASLLEARKVSDRTIPASYISPEALIGDGSDSRVDPFASDQWALGVALYALLSGNFPFDQRDADELFQRMWAGPPELPDHISPHARDLCTALLDRSPLFRPDCATALRHEWFCSGQRKSLKRACEKELIPNDDDETQGAEEDAVVPVFVPKRRHKDNKTFFPDDDEFNDD